MLQFDPAIRNRRTLALVSSPRELMKVFSPGASAHAEHAASDFRSNALAVR